MRQGEGGGALWLNYQSVTDYNMPALAVCRDRSSRQTGNRSAVDNDQHNSMCSAFLTLCVGERDRHGGQCSPSSLSPLAPRPSPLAPILLT